MNHYNGPAELDKHTKLVKVELQLLYYKNEKYMSFKLFSGKIKSCYLVINKNPDDERLSPRQQVTAMLSCIHAKSPELQAMKTTICQNYADDLAGTCAFFSSMVSDLYGEAQVKYHRDHIRKWCISAVNHGG